MLKKLLVTTALSGLMVSAALAQSSSPSSPTTAPSASSPPAASSSPSSPSPSASSPSSSSDAMKADSATKADASKSSASSSASTIASQKPDQLLMSKVKGADVLGSDDKKIGDVSDILFSKDGKIEAYVLSVGGFLGVGAKEVALAPSSLQLTQDKDEWKFKISMSKDQLAQAPNFERHKEQRTTTGAGQSGTGMGSSGSAPRNAPSGSANPPAQRQ
jgi:hypothetical protein